MMFVLTSLADDTNLSEDRYEGIFFFSFLFEAIKNDYQDVRSTHTFGKRERPCYFKLVLQIVWGFNKILRKGLLPVVIYLYVKDRAICMLGFHGLFFFLCNAEDSSYESSPLNEWYVIRSFITRALTSVSLSYKILAQCKFFFCYCTEWFLCQH